METTPAKKEKNPLSALKNIKSSKLTPKVGKNGKELDSTVNLRGATGRGFVSTRNVPTLKLSTLLGRPAQYIKNYPHLASHFDLTKKQKELIESSTKQEIKAYYDSLDNV